MNNNRLALAVSIIALVLSIIVITRVARNPYERSQMEACDRGQANCRSQCDLQKTLALNRLSVDSSLRVFQRNQDLRGCHIENIGNSAAIEECERQVNEQFATFLQGLEARRQQIESSYTECLTNCANEHAQCYSNIKTGPVGVGDGGRLNCEPTFNACTISIPSSCEHSEIEITVSCEELECMGIPCHGDAPGLPVCVKPGPIEEGFNMEYKIVNEGGKEIDRFPALWAEPNCKFSVRHDKETITRIRKYSQSQIHFSITSKAKPPLTIKFEKSN